VRAATREKVLRTIKKYEYVPDNGAVFLKRLKTKKIGVIVPDITNPGSSVTVQMMHDLFKTRGYHLILGNTYGEVSEEKDILEMMQRERVAGIIIATYAGEDDSILYPYFERLVKSGISIVFMGKNKENLPVDVLSVNNTSGALKITEYLIKTGRKKIGFIAGSRYLRATEERLKGYLKAMKRKGLVVPQGLILCEDGYTMENGEKLGDILLKKDIDGIVCGNDAMAIGVMKAAEERGINIPGDVAITGFDDSFLASLVKPKLTTVHQPTENIVTTGCERLIGRIEGKCTAKYEELLFEPEVIVRESA